MLGYPFFIQMFDPREDEERYEKYDTLLFQMSSFDSDYYPEYSAIWGDLGMAYFFINHNDLINLNF